MAAAFYCAPALGGFGAYIGSLTITSKEGANGLALLYLFPVFALAAFLAVWLIRDGRATNVFLISATGLYFSAGAMIVRDYYTASHCRLSYADRHNGVGHSPTCDFLLSLSRW